MNDVADLVNALLAKSLCDKKQDKQFNSKFFEKDGTKCIYVAEIVHVFDTFDTKEKIWS